MTQTFITNNGCAAISTIDFLINRWDYLLNPYFREPNPSHKVLNRIHNFLKHLSDIIYKKTNKFAKLYSKMPGAIPQHTTFCVTWRMVVTPEKNLWYGTQIKITQENAQNYTNHNDQPVLWKYIIIRTHTNKHDNKKTETGKIVQCEWRPWRGFCSKQWHGYLLIFDCVIFYLFTVYVFIW